MTTNAAHFSHGAGPSPRFAVVLRTYQWDDFIARQATRFAAASDGGDFFLSLDETRGPLATVGHDLAFRTTDDDLLALGLPNRFKQGSLVWWNNDYPQYAFARAHPDYDFYVFVEYDSLVQCSIRALVEQVAARGLDFVASPVPGPIRQWFWWPHTSLVYDADDIRASINCISVLSRRALDLLFERRLAMGRDRSIRHWPISEAFVATEIERASFRSAPLAEFGDISAYDWFPPLLEEDLGRVPSATFIHPVLDTSRYLSSVLRNQASPRGFFNPTSTLRQSLARLPKSTWRGQLPRACLRSFRSDMKVKLERRLFRRGLARAW